MTIGRQRIIKALKDRGFTGVNYPFELFYWVNEGWYLYCDQVNYVCIGQNTDHVVEITEKGENDHYLE